MPTAAADISAAESTVEKHANITAVWGIHAILARPDIEDKEKGAKTREKLGNMFEIRIKKAGLTELLGDATCERVLNVLKKDSA